MQHLFWLTEMKIDAHLIHRQHNTKITCSALMPQHKNAQNQRENKFTRKSFTVYLLQIHIRRTTQSWLVFISEQTCSSQIPVLQTLGGILLGDLGLVCTYIKYSFFHEVLLQEPPFPSEKLHWKGPLDPRPAAAFRNLQGWNNPWWGHRYWQDIFPCQSSPLLKCWNHWRNFSHSPSTMQARLLWEPHFLVLS